MLFSKSCVLLVFIVISFLVPIEVQALINLRISAPSALLIDAESGTVLFEKDSKLKVNPTSFTKLMFIYLIFDKLNKEEIHLSDIVKVSSNAVSKAYKSRFSNMSLRKGEKVSLEKLLIGITLLSANDAAIALAEFIYGSEEALIDNMNYMTSFVGLKNTNFTNIIGTNDSNQFTTAEDLVVLASLIIKKFPQYLVYFKIPSLQHNNVLYRNKNDMLFANYPRNVIVDGLQIDTSIQTGYSILFSAVQGKTNFRIIGVILGANSEEHKNLLSQGMLNWCYNNFTKKIIYNKGDFIVKIPVIGSSAKDINIIAKEDITYITVKKQTKKKEKVVLSHIDFIKNSYPQNSVLATIKVEGNGNYNLSYEIKSEEEIVPEDTILQILYAPYYLIKMLLFI